MAKCTRRTVKVGSNVNLIGVRYSHAYIFRRFRVYFRLLRHDSALSEYEFISHFLLTDPATTKLNKMVRLVVFVAALFLGAVICYPAQESKEDGSSEVAFVPLETGPYRPRFLESDEVFGEQPIIDTPAYYGPYFNNPFGGFWGSIQDVLARMRQQLAQVLTRLPALNGTEDAFHVSTFGDLGKGNTTSVTKIIDGHKVVINETEYKKDGPNGGAFVKISVIDVRPESSETAPPDSEPVLPITTSSSVPAPAGKDRESVEDSLENEIPKTSEDTNFDNLETFDEADAIPMKDVKWNEVDSFSAHNPDVQFEPIDLSNDIEINRYMADAGVSPDPDAELIDAIDAELAFKKLGNSKFEKLTYYPQI